MSWDALQRCWGTTSELGEMADHWNREQAQAQLDKRAADHRAALDQLVAAGELVSTTADTSKLKNTLAPNP